MMFLLNFLSQFVFTDNLNVRKGTRLWVPRWRHCKGSEAVSLGRRSKTPTLGGIGQVGQRSCIRRSAVEDSDVCLKCREWPGWAMGVVRASMSDSSSTDLPTAVNTRPLPVIAIEAWQSNCGGPVGRRAAFVGRRSKTPTFV